VRLDLPHSLSPRSLGPRPDLAASPRARRKHADSGGAFRVQVYSPYILVNKTGLPFALKTKTFFGSAKSVAGLEEFSSAAAKRKPNEPFMFSYPTDDRRNRSLLRVGDSNWSQQLSFETIGLTTEVILPSATGQEEIRVGLKVTEGLGDVRSASSSARAPAHPPLELAR